MNGTAKTKKQSELHRRMGLATSAQALEALVADDPAIYRVRRISQAYLAAVNGLGAAALGGASWLGMTYALNSGIAGAAVGGLSVLAATRIPKFAREAKDWWRFAKQSSQFAAAPNKSGPIYLTAADRFTRNLYDMEIEGAQEVKPYNDLAEIPEEQLSVVNGVEILGKAKITGIMTVALNEEGAIMFASTPTTATLLLKTRSGTIQAPVSYEIAMKYELLKPIPPKLFLVGHIEGDQYKTQWIGPALTVEDFYERNRPRGPRRKQEAPVGVWKPALDVFG